MTARGIPFSEAEVERIADEARRRGIGRAEFIRQCVLRTIEPGYALTDKEDHRVFEAARALNTSKAEFCTRAILHACDEVESIGLYREPISPFRPRGA